MAPKPPVLTTVYR